MHWHGTVASFPESLPFFLNLNLWITCHRFLCHLLTLIMGLQVFLLTDHGRQLFSENAPSYPWNASLCWRCWCWKLVGSLVMYCGLTAAYLKTFVLKSGRWNVFCSSIIQSKIQIWNMGHFLHLYIEVHKEEHIHCRFYCALFYVSLISEWSAFKRNNSRKELRTI